MAPAALSPHLGEVPRASGRAGLLRREYLFDSILWPPLPQKKKKKGAATTDAAAAELVHSAPMTGRSGVEQMPRAQADSAGSSKAGQAVAAWRLEPPASRLAARGVPAADPDLVSDG